MSGDLIDIRVNLCGQVNGAPATLPTRMQLRVAGGRIAAMTHVMGADAMRAWAHVAAAGGLAAADALLAGGD